jgi:anti-sigma factor RsiW
MTSPTGTAQHPDVSEIADLTEGLLSPSRTTEVRRHLDGCPLCADVHASLEEIKGLLGTLPGPTRMPDDVAGRIDAALAAEALLDARGSEATPHVSRETSADAAADGPVGLAETATTPADPSRAERPGRRSRGVTGPGRGGPVRPARPARRRRRAVLGAVFGTAFGAAAIGVGVLLSQSVGGSDNSATGGSADTRAGATQNGRVEFTDGHLKASVDSLLHPRPEATGPGGRKQDDSTAGKQSTPNSPMLQQLPAVPQCIQRGTGRTEPAIAVEQGTYHGDRAYLVVLPHADDTTRVQAYVIDATCVKSAPATKGKVLLTHAYPRY